jgi:HEAT repeat protein
MTATHLDGCQMDTQPTRPIQALVHDLIHRDPVVRRAAENELVALPVPALLAALHDPDHDVRVTAMDEVARLHGLRAIEAWVLLPRRTNSFLRGDLLVNLAYTDDPRALPILTAALKDRSSAVRARAAYALRERGDPAAIEPLLACLTDNVIAVRQTAVEALGVLRTRTAITPLLALLSHSNKYLRRSIVTALGQIADPHVIQPLITCLTDKDACVQQLAACTLGTFGTAALPLLTDALTHTQRAVRRGAIHALGHIGGEHARAALLALRTDRSKEVRAEIDRALHKLDRPADSTHHVLDTA